MAYVWWYSTVPCRVLVRINKYTHSYYYIHTCDVKVGIKPWHLEARGTWYVYTWYMYVYYTWYVVRSFPGVHTFLGRYIHVCMYTRGTVPGYEY